MDSPYLAAGIAGLIAGVVIYFGVEIVTDYMAG